MKRVSKSDFILFKNELRKNLQSNIYIYGNLIKYGLENDNVLFYSCEGFDFVLMQYFDDYVFSTNKKIDGKVLNEIAKKLNKSKDSAISGVESSIQQLLPYLEKVSIKKTKLMKFNTENSSFQSQSQNDLILAKKNDISELSLFFLGIPEFSFKYNTNNAINRLTRTIENDLLAYAREGKLISFSATATAISDVSCMLTDISVDKDHRNKGLGKKYTRQFCEYLLGKNISNIYLYVESPIALEVYQKIGFMYISDYWVVRFFQHNNESNH